ncbi:uridine kinase [Solibacillus sp. R5-41]|uniref:kinase n=1 Tax=Solibacillus sp. R5-41 TaxID=2048654 RepID=UPI000C127A81|nr:kinase [Solibacillus sp. R5-41]ATP41678.1 uridine kinase [Solibacillus sp. R5-41]
MAMNDTLKREIQEVYKKHYLDRPFIVAIDGLGGAGKTTLVDHLKNILDNVVIIHIDDHIVERESRYNTGHDEWFEYYQLQWDANHLKESLFEKLHQNVKQLHLSFYNNEEDTSTSKTITILPNSIVIIEGIFLLREEWKVYFDYIIFLDCPKEVRYERVLQRDTYIGVLEERLKKYQNRYWLAEDYYIKKQNPLKFAHNIQRL